MLALTLLTACAGSRTPAPIVEYKAPQRAKPVPAQVSADVGGLPRYRVKVGDTLIKIAFEHDLDYRLLASLNELSPPYLIHPGQDLRLGIPLGAPRTAAMPASHDEILARPLPRRDEIREASAAMPANVAWVWPVRGSVINDFDSTRGQKGMDIAGAADAPIRAANAGKVVYAGSALRGYGKLAIIKHSQTVLSAYGHLSRLQVQEGQDVAAGQVIGTMGDTDADRVKLHFEIREYGKAVDPRLYLPRQS
jgi:lipoprotein NlpD